MKNTGFFRCMMGVGCVVSIWLLSLSGCTDGYLIAIAIIYAALIMKED